ncbi:MAG: DNA translocase FtsK [Anaerolineae bacterium]
MQRELLGLLLVVFTIVSLLALFAVTPGVLTDSLARFLAALFGWGAVPAMLGVGVLGILMMVGNLSQESQSLPLDIIVGVEIVFVALLALLHIVAGGNDSLAVAQGGGGGIVGWALSAFLVNLVGGPLASLVLVLLGVVGLGFAFRLSWQDVWSFGARTKTWMQTRLVPRLDRWRQALADPSLEGEPLHYEEVRPQAPRRSKKKAKPAALDPPTMTAEAAIEAMPARAGRRSRKLPPLELLAPPAQTTEQSLPANTRYQAQIIEETLRGFGVPAEVVEINRGPTVTQFGLQLGTIERRMANGTIVQQRVRVSKVTSLVNDLALALAAAPIRIEAPVPGRPIVGIEVPNSNVSLVSLRGVLESPEFRRGKGGLKIALGRGGSGEPIGADLTAMPHLLIAGATGSGKSVCLNAIITCLLVNHRPEDLRLLLIDPKMVELVSFNGLPHLLAPVVTDLEQVVGALAWVTREMERRYKLFAGQGVRSIATYNRKVGRNDKLPYMVVVVDELADLMMLASDEVERYICRIAQMARATGIHLIIATQRPSVDVVTGLIKANFPARIAFAVTSQIDSRVILDTPGAECLLGRGDMLYMAPDSPKLARLQGCFVSDAEIENIVTFWKKVDAEAEVAAMDMERPSSLPWAGLVAEAEKDDLLEEAVRLVVETGRASTTFLQRRLGIGYPRASRLIDQLEEEGIIGPADGARPRQVLWREDRADADYAEFKSDVGSTPGRK